MDVQTMSVVIAAVSVVIGVINSILSSRRAAENDQMMLETRQAQLFSQISSWWRSREAIKAYRNIRYHYYEDKIENNLSWSDFFEKYGSHGDVEAYSDQMTLWAFFEGIGILVKKNLIDVEIVNDLLSGRMIWMWENMIGPNVDLIRKVTDDPTQYDSIEYLYHEMKHRQRLTTRPEVN